MEYWYDQTNYFWDIWGFETETVEESETIDLDYYGLTDDEVAAFNEARRGIFYDTWLDYIQDWD